MRENKEAIITIVGFLGAGKTTLLKKLVDGFIDQEWDPFIVLNDYENAYLDVKQFYERISERSVKPLSGSCICCSGINELRDFVNRIPQRGRGVTLIEANGTSDSCSLMGFLGVGIDERYLPPVQLSVVDVKNWQLREEHNELEASQIQVSSMIVLTHLAEVTKNRETAVRRELKKINPTAVILKLEEVKPSVLTDLVPSTNQAKQIDHKKAHWASCSVDLPTLPDKQSVYDLCNQIPSSILRVKGCTQIGEEQDYTYFERTPDGSLHFKSYYGEPTTGPKLLSIGLGSDDSLLQKAISLSLQNAATRLSSD